MYPNQRPFEVHMREYSGRVAVISTHFSIKEACKSLASTIRNTKGIYGAYIWCARDNLTYPLNTARTLLARGYFDGMK